MSPSRPVTDIKVQVPRHNTARIGPALTAQITTIAKEQGVRTDLRQSNHDPASALALAIESASDWNSLLTTARADRGPQWDVGTQQFHVEQGSDLYYDPAPLLEYLKEGQQEGNQSSDAAPPEPATPLMAHRQQQFNMGGQFPMNGMLPHSSAIAASPRHMGGQMGTPHHGGQFGAIPPGQFYGVGDPSRGSPMVPRVGMIMDGMGMSPDVRRRM
ncbi:hypothetical protein EW146_g679 [Bondarzewia mesenterica]|uniref:Uncharacterized protein n=1 Tax=Bondarzewia mesenterica TaxID=1095465 RepID=A0A4S4M6Q3_9AGAM|nr:hypothetical protein EW146_g679 [Bondarzewia mesenterica]